MARETDELARFITGAAAEELPEEATRRLRYLILDNVASGLLGARQSCYRMTADAIIAISGAGDAPIFGYPAKLDITRATFLNGVAIGSFEVDHITSGAHGGGTVFPAVLALGASTGASGAQIVRALAVGYEVNARVAAAQTGRAEEERGFHNPAISGVFGSAAACALLLGLDHEQTLSALGLAGSHACGLIECVWTGAMTKRIHLGRAAEMGLESTLLARQGVTGPPTVLEGQYGFLNAYSPKPKPEKLTEDLGQKWIFTGTRVKPYPGHGVIQPFVPVLDAWRANQPDAAAAITGIEIITSHQGTEQRFLDPAPNSLLGAQYSLAFLTGVVLARGIDGLIGLDETVLQDDRVRELAAKVTVATDDRFQGSVSSAGGEVRITTGTSANVLEASGLPKPSLDELRTVCRGKLERYAEGILPKESVSRLEELAEDFEGLATTAEVIDLIFSR